MWHEAGCDNADILNHFRQDQQCPICFGVGRNSHAYSEPWDEFCSICHGKGNVLEMHYRGCHVLDAILGKE